MSTLRPDHFEFVRDLVRRRAGIVLEDGKEYLVEARLTALARTHGTDLAALVDTAVGGRTALHDEIVDAMTTNETSFFRDLHPFETLRTEILPRLVEMRRASRTIRILSGAASTGQEAYSIALMIRTHFPELLGWDVQIIGTDISREALAKARAGRYTQLEINRGLPATMLRWFTQAGREFVLDDSVRSLVEFRELNLVEPWPLLPTCDLVLLRNVLIYFDLPTKATILGRLRQVVAPDGLLFLGASETTLNIDPSWTPLRLGPSTVYAPDAARSHPWSSPTMISAS